MTTIKHHRKAIEILEAIQFMRRRAETWRECLSFPVGREKILHNLDIAEKSINRLKQRYETHIRRNQGDL